MLGVGVGIYVSSLSGLDEFYYRIKDPNKYHTGHVTSVVPVNSIISPNVLKVIPIIISRSQRLDKIGMRLLVNGAAGSKCRLGIYNDNTSNYPKDLLVDSGDIAIDAGAGIPLKTVDINLRLSTGLYWLAYNQSNNGTIHCANDTGLLNILGSNGDSLYNIGWYSALAYGALPTTFPQGANVFETGGNDIPLVYYRIAEFI